MNKFYIPNHNFVKLRKKIGATQDDIARLLETKRANVGAIEEHRAQISIGKIYKLIKIGLLHQSELFGFLYDKDLKISTAVNIKKIIPA